MLENFNQNKKAEEEKESLNMAVVHFNGLYDLDEDMSGEQFDPVTGEKINNSTDDLGATELHTIQSKKVLGWHDALPPLPEEDDAAAKWLREHEAS
jgi:hypothetical protein